MATVTPTRITLGDLAADPKRHRKERTVRTVFLLMALTSLAISAAIILSLLGETWTFVSQVELSALTADGWFPRSGKYGLSTIIAGTVIVTIVAMFVAAPIGLASAIYLSEYAKPRSRRVLKPVLEILAGVPSVVLGFFAFTFLSPEVVQRIFPGTPQGNLLVAGLGVGILTVPLVASISEDAMRAVPNSLREASYGMGARKITTSLRVVLPAAVSGLVAALIIAFSRAIGETMVVFLAAGAGNGAFFTLNPLEAGTTMTAAMATQASGTDAVVGEALTFQSLFFVGFLLFTITLTLNLLADRIVRKYRQAY